MKWINGRGILGPLKPLVGQWVTATASGSTPAASMRCSRAFSRWVEGWIELDARWSVSADNEYRERAFFGASEGKLTCFSLTSDGKHSVGHLVDGSDVDVNAIAFEAAMPAGIARMIYWPLSSGEPGFRFAVESKTKTGWNRFLEQQFVPQFSDPTLEA